MLTAYFYLRANDIATLKLNDKIRINNSWWSINSINDYNANENTLTKVELLTIDDEVDLPPYQTKPKQPWQGTNETFSDIIGKYFTNNNVTDGGGVVIGDIGHDATDGNNYFKSVTTDSINGIPQLQQHVWKAKLTQTGTNAIVIESVMIDTVGFNITSDYLAKGHFSLSGFDMSDFGYTATFDEINVEINNSNGILDKDWVEYYLEGTTIFINTYKSGSSENDVLPSDTTRSFILTLTLYI